MIKPEDVNAAEAVYNNLLRDYLIQEGWEYDDYNRWNYLDEIKFLSAEEAFWYHT